MSKQDDLNEKMLELIHELLPAAEAEQLLQRISSDPDAARAYAEAKQQADLFAKAARLEEDRLQLKRPPASSNAVSPAGNKAGPPATSNTGGQQAVRWALALAALLLVAVTAGGYLYQQLTGQDIAQKHMRLLVASPASLAAGVDNQITITTQAINGTSVPAKLEFALYDERQQQLLDARSRFVDAAADGVTRFTIPADVELTEKVRFEVMAYHNGKYQRATTPLAVTPDRNVTQIALDKPWYKPGDTVHYRSVTLSSHTLAASNDVPITFEILDPSGATVAGSQLQGITERGVGNGQFELPPGLPGGQYTIVVRSLDGSTAEQRRQFLVRSYRLPRLKKELEFARDSYIPGDTVVADVAATRAEGGAAVGAALSVIATVDGKTVFSQTEKLDANGAFQVSFALPEEIDVGNGQLAVIVDDGGTRETIAKTLPINLGRVEVEFYPEGGDLVAGVTNRVYFVARDPKGDPVHVEGRVLDGEGNKVADVQTGHQGRGVFQYVPQSTVQYRLELDKPAGVRLPVELPEAAGDARIVLTTANDKTASAGGGVYGAGEPITLDIRGSDPDIPLVIAAYCRGLQVGQATYTTGEDIKPGSVSIPLSDAVEGVVRLTVYDYSGRRPEPVAERLVYRRPSRSLNVEIVDHSEQYSPGDNVELSLLVTDEQGRPAADSTLGVAVVDDALLGLARETQRHKPAGMPTHFRLAAEIEKPEDLEDVEFYVDDNAEAAVALDLLLGTQGWRRFAQQTLDALPAEGGPELEVQRQQLDNLMVSYGVDQPPAVYDNLPEAQQAYAIERSEYEQRRTAWLAALGTVVLGGGIFLILVVAATAMLRWASSPRTLVPALAASTFCLLVGAYWMSADPDSDSSTVASAPYVLFSITDDDSEVARLEEPVMEVADPGFDDHVDFAANEEVEELRELAPGEPLPVDAADAGLDEEDIAGGGPPVLDDAQAEKGEEFAKEALERVADGLLADVADADELFRAEADLEFENNDQKKRHLGWEIGQLGDLRQQLAQAAVNGKDARRKNLANQLDRVLQQHRFPVRQYAHVHTLGEPGVRSDFTETVYWNPLLITDEDGRALVRFDLSDAVTAFRVQADAHGGGDGDQAARIGTGDGEVIARIPFSLQPKLPLEVNAGDLIDLPIAVVNDTDGILAVEVALEHSRLFELDGPAARVSELAPGQRQREYFQLAVVGQTGDAEVKFRGAAGAHGDAVSQTIKVVPPGFPASVSYAGKLQGEEAVLIEMPDDWVEGSLEVALQVYPSTLADLQKGLEGMLRDPYGCFEQASTSNYPNVLALDYMQEHRVADPAFTKRAKDLLKKGYAKLAGYECKEKGYEWFGSDPGHEALTAYGLMEFHDMTAVYDVDPAMVQRTANWLLSRRDGKGRFLRNAKALDSFGGAPEAVTNAYIVWALTEARQQGLDAELAHVVELGRKTKDPYVLALAAASAMGGGSQDAGRELLGKLKDMQNDDGHLEGTQGSITRSGGHSLKVETTAIAALAWLKDPAFTVQANQAVDWIVGSRQGSGGFGSTQATIMALKALVQHAQANRATVAGGELIVMRGEEQIGRAEFQAGARDAITVEGLADKLQPGVNNLTLRLSGDNQMPYSIEVAYRTRTPVSDEQCPVRLNVDLAEDRVPAGETVAMTATLTNMTDQGQPMTLAVLGIPAGLTVRPDQLDELKRSGVIDYFETNAREVICYWRALAPHKKIDLRLDLVADIPGRYTAPASRAYLYYTAEQKWWVDPVAIRIER